LLSLDRQEPLQSVKVLHLDDSPSQLNLTKLIIERIDPGLFIEKISSIKEALKRLREEDFDCIISDYDLPTMNGVSSL
jgi:CheY-like chemotaxis protein